jgi:hypothetical protein
MYIPSEHPEYALATIGLDSATLSARPGLAILEMAGRDSVAAGVAAVRERGYAVILPTSVATGTEYGDEMSPAHAVEYLRGVLPPEVEVLDPLRLGSPPLWAALNGRYSTVIAERYRIYSPCLACHLYVHLARLPLARLLGNVPIVSGERETHGGRIKLSQTALGIDACIRVLAHADVELFEPIRRLHDSEAIVELVGTGWDQGARQLNCVHSGNYAQVDGTVTFDELAYTRYLHGFFEPVGRAVIDAWAHSPEPDYLAVVRDVLNGPDAA